MATTAKAKSAGKGTVKAEQPGLFLYIGPSIRGAVQENAILSGKLSEIKAQLQPVIERYPQVATLIVPVETLVESRRDVKTRGTLLHKMYAELAASE